MYQYASVVHGHHGDPAGHWGKEGDLKRFDKGQSVTLTCFGTLLTLTPFDMDFLPEQITLTTEQGTTPHRWTRVQHTHTHTHCD